MSADNAIIVMETVGGWEVWHELNPHRIIKKPPNIMPLWKYKTQAMAYALGLMDGLGLVEHGIIVIKKEKGKRR